MGDACNHLAATIQAKNQASGKDIFSEAERVIQMNAEQRAYYEKFMANEFGLGKGSKKPSVWDALKARQQKQLNKKTHAYDAAAYNHPSERFSKKFWGAIDNKITKWANSKNADYDSYKEQVGKPARTLLKAINQVATSGKSPATVNRELAKFGLTAKDVYDAKGYLQFLADGGHMQGHGNAQGLVNTAGFLSRAQANLNVVWSLGSGTDLIRPTAHYLTRKNGMVNTLKGIGMWAKATKGIGAFSKLKELENKRIYDSAYQDHGTGKADLFGRSIIGQKNLVYYLDKAAGGDGATGIREQLFDYKPWDVPPAERWKGSPLVFGLARYPINETRWLFKTANAAIRGNPREIANLTVYFAMRAVATGTTSNVPAWMWNGMPDEWKETLEQIDKDLPFNLIKKASTSVFQQMGVDAGLDLSGYTRPMGGSFGARAGQLVTSISGVGTSGTKAVSSAAQGKFDAAAAHSAATLLALANLGLLGGVLKKIPGGEKAAEKFSESQLNSTTLTKLFKTLGDELEKEFDAERTPRNVVKAVFGQQNIKKAE